MCISNSFLFTAELYSIVKLCHTLFIHLPFMDMGSLGGWGWESDFSFLPHKPSDDFTISLEWRSLNRCTASGQGRQRAAGCTGIYSNYRTPCHPPLPPNLIAFSYNKYGRAWARAGRRERAAGPGWLDPAGHREGASSSKKHPNKRERIFLSGLGSGFLPGLCRPLLHLCVQLRWCRHCFGLQRERTSLENSKKKKS